MSKFGNYRIDDVVFPAPATAVWEEVPIAAGLNGLPINSSYRIHTWNFPGLEADLAEQLFAKYAEQQTNAAQLTTLETDPYNAELAGEAYGTMVYTDFVITEISPRTRGMPFYDNVTVKFEVYVA